MSSHGPSAGRALARLREAEQEKAQIWAKALVDALKASAAEAKEQK